MRCHFENSSQASRAVSKISRFENRFPYTLDAFWLRSTFGREEIIPTCITMSQNIPILITTNKFTKFNYCQFLCRTLWHRTRCGSTPHFPSNPARVRDKTHKSEPVSFNFQPTTQSCRNMQLSGSIIALATLVMMANAKPTPGRSRCPSGCMSIPFP
jgi:hypothetical protein